MAKSKVKMLRHIPSGNVHILGKTENWDSMVDRATQYNNGRISICGIYNKPVTEFEVVENYEFDDTLTFDGFYTGNSTFGGYFSGTHIKKASVWASQMPEFINKMEYGKITGRFTFEKRGQSTGLVLVSSTPLF